MAYTPYEWQDLPSLETPIVAEKLNHIEQGIKNAHDDISGVVEAVVEIDETIGTIQSALSDTQSDLQKASFGEQSGGKNLWDERWEVGGIDGSTGQNIGGDDRYRSIGYIAVKPSTRYLLIHPYTMYVCTYNSSKGFIAKTAYSAGKNEITTDANTNYLRFFIYGGGATYHNDIAIIRGTSGEYEPYIASNKMLTNKATNTDIALAEIKLLGWTVPEECPIKNELNGNVFTQRVGRVDLGLLSWTYDSVNDRFKSYDLTDVKLSTRLTELYCNIYELKHNGEPFNKNWDKVIYIAKELYVHDHAYTDATDFKNAMNGVYLYYELATPITMNVEGNEIDWYRSVSKIYSAGTYTIRLPKNCSFILNMETSSEAGLSAFIGGAYNAGAQYSTLHTITKRSDVSASISGNVLTFTIAHQAYVGIKVF